MARQSIIKRITTPVSQGLSSISQRVQGLFEAKEAPFRWPVNLNGPVRWQMGNFREYAQLGFSTNAIIYSAIMYKVRAVTQAPPRAVIGTLDSPEMLPASHPLSRLLARPNSHMNWIQFQGALTTYLNIAGNAYIYIDREKAKRGIPSALWPIRPDEMFLIPETNTIKGYMYVPRAGTILEGIPMLLEDVIHVKFPNPLDPFSGMGYGLSPMASLSQSGDVDNQVTRFLKGFFENGAQPAGILSFNHALDQDQVTRIKERWREVYGGVDNWSDIGVLDQGATYKSIAYNFNEMGFDILDTRNESRIIGPFGVPPILLGTRFGLQNATYSNYEEARKAFWQDTMTYELRLFETELQNRIVGDDGSYIYYDMSSVPALRLNAQPLVDAAHKLWTMGVPAEEALRVVGLRVGEFAGGDVSWIPTSVRDSTKEPVAPTPPTLPKRPSVVDEGEEEVPDEEDTDSSEREKGRRRGTSRAATTKASDDSRAAAVRAILDESEPAYLTAARESFAEDLRVLLTEVDEATRKARSRKASIDWRELLGSYDEYLVDESPETWRKKFIPAVSGAIGGLGDLWSAELGVRFDLRSIEAEEWFQTYTLTFSAPIIATTSDTIHDLIAQAQSEGWSNQVLQRRLQEIFGVWMTGELPPDQLEWLKSRLPDYRAEMIARTELTRSTNAGSQSLYADWGVKRKQWLTSMDGRERESHGKANNQIVNIDETFVVGGFNMRHPGDTSEGASVAEIVNCRCTILPVLD